MTKLKNGSVYDENKGQPPFMVCIYVYTHTHTHMNPDEFSILLWKNINSKANLKGENKDYLLSWWTTP